MISLKSFIKAKNEDKSANSDSNTQTKYGESSGHCRESAFAAKNIYESIVGNDGDSTKQLKSLRTVKRVEQTDKHITKQFNINSVMKAVEINNVNEVKSMMQGNENNINMTDQFGWTPLMSACCAGSVDTVQYLLQLNPDLGVRDKKGNTCYNLANSKGNYKIINLLKKYLKTSKSPAQSNNSNTQNIVRLKKDSLVKEFFCDICRQSFKNTDRSEHITSTVHLFNSASNSKMPTMYGIPESNKGFQMLLRHGWDKEKGLGPEGSGHKFPLKTILKQDRLGLGAKQYTTRVTHPTAEIIEKSKMKCGLKQDLKAMKRKEKRKERAIRRMLN